VRAFQERINYEGKITWNVGSTIPLAEDGIKKEKEKDS
jgi:hypothetical protein